MVFKRSVLKIQKQRTKSCKDPSYGYGEINQNVPKFAVWPKMQMAKVNSQPPGSTIGVRQYFLNIFILNVCSTTYYKILVMKQSD